MAKISVADLNMTVPDGFTLHMAVVAAKPENKFCRNVVIAKEQVMPGTTVDQYKQAQLKMLSQSSAGCTLTIATAEPSTTRPVKVKNRSRE